MNVLNKDNMFILNAYSNDELEFKLNSQHLIKNSLNSHFVRRYNIWVALRSWLITHIRKPYIACFAKIFVLKRKGEAKSQNNGVAVKTPPEI